jgi:hypothetical protein
MEYIEKEFQIIEILAKTNYQIVIHKDKNLHNPIAFGSGFFLNFKDNLFFLTADHNIHIEDHKLNARTGDDNYVGILNNISDVETLSTVMTPITEFYYMEKIDFFEPEKKAELFDVAISLINRANMTAPFVTDENILDSQGNILVNRNERKFEFLEQHISEPKLADTYFIKGKVRPEIKGIMLHRKNAHYEGIKFVEKYGDYILLKTPDLILDSEDWAGLSGSPVLNQLGECIGVLCSVFENSQSIWVKPFEKIKPLLEVIILQEKLKHGN